MPYTMSLAEFKALVKQVAVDARLPLAYLWPPCFYEDHVRNPEGVCVHCENYAPELESHCHHYVFIWVDGGSWWIDLETSWVDLETAQFYEEHVNKHGP